MNEISNLSYFPYIIALMVVFFKVFSVGVELALYQGILGPCIGV